MPNRIVPHTAAVCLFTPDDRMLVLRENDQTLWLYDVKSGHMLRSMRLDGATLAD